MSLSRSQIPSTDEIKSTKRMIRELETRLEEAIQAQLQNVIDELQQELGHCRAWIAPVYRAPLEILSMVFIEASQIDWNIPFVVGAVCRYWRLAILDTPQAWTFIPLKQIATATSHPVLLGRSAPYPVDFDITSPADLHLLPVMDQVTERVRCLAVIAAQFEITSRSFSSLTTLILGNPSESMYTPNAHALLDGQLFPRLRRLHSGNVFDSIQGPLPPYSTLAPIEELSFTTRDHQRAAGIIQTLAPQLVLLYVFFTSIYSGNATELTEIDFPLMTSLIIVEPRSSGKPQWVFDAHTPLLKTYIQGADSAGENIHQDTNTVERLAFLYGVDFKRFPNVREAISTPGGIDVLLDRLEAAPKTFLPNLEMVTCERSSNMEARLCALKESGRSVVLNSMSSSVRFLSPPHACSYSSFPCPPSLIRLQLGNPTPSE